jgi:hypothetical protein
MPFVPGALIATAALKVPGLPPNATGFTVTCKVPGKLPAVGLTLSQGGPLAVMGVAVKFVMLELELDSDTVCEVAEESPAGKTKLREFGLALMEPDGPVEFAFNVTGIEKFVVVEVTLMKPTSIPDVGAPAPTETVTNRGVVPLCGVTVSQLVSECEVTETFTLPVVEESRIVWGGVVTPVWVLNVSCCGVATTAFV